MPFPAVIDNTMRKSFVACPQKFWRSHIQNLYPKNRSIHLIAGGAYAKGLETYRRDYYQHKLPKDTCLRNAVVACIAEWGDNSPEDDYKSLENMCLAIEEHFRIWPPESDFVQPYVSNGKAAIEFTFAIPIPGTRHPDTGDPVLYAGRFDMLGIYQNSSLVVVDDKTQRQWVRRGLPSGTSNLSSPDTAGLPASMDTRSWAHLSRVCASSKPSSSRKSLYFNVTTG